MEPDFIADALADIGVQKMAMQQGLANMAAMLEKSTLSATEESFRSISLSRLHYHFSSISIHHLVGSGSFGLVYEGEYSGQVVAIKKLVKPNGSAWSVDEKKAIENEILLTALMSNPNIIRVYGYCEDGPGCVFIIMDYASRGCLWSMLQDKINYPVIPLSLLLYWQVDILRGLDYCHSMSVLHRDIKAENVLLFDGLKCKLCDFGLAKRKIGGMSSSHHCAVTRCIIQV